MKNAEETNKAKKYLSDNGYGTGSNFTLNTVAYLMEEYASQFASSEMEAYNEMQIRLRQILKPLEDLYRSDNPDPQGRFYLPDTADFYRWIVQKVQIALPTEEEIKEEAKQCYHKESVAYIAFIEGSKFILSRLNQKETKTE